MKKASIFAILVATAMTIASCGNSTSTSNETSNVDSTKVQADSTTIKADSSCCKDSTTTDSSVKTK